MATRKICNFLNISRPRLHISWPQQKNRCVRLEEALCRPIGKSIRLQSGAELKAETSSRTLSSPGSEALAVFAYSITDEVNKMQYLPNTQTY